MLKIVVLLSLLASFVFAYDIKSIKGHPVYVSNSLIQTQTDRRACSSLLKCTAMALSYPDVPLFCFVDGECVFTQLIRASGDATGISDPVLCMTRFEKGSYPCTKGGHLVNPSSGCLSIQRTERNFEDAESHCQTMGMNLASLESLTSYSQLETLRETYESMEDDGFYIGSSRTAPSSQYYWNTGTVMSGNSPLWCSAFSDPNIIWFTAVEDAVMIYIGEFDGQHCARDTPRADEEFSICSFP